MSIMKVDGNQLVNHGLNRNVLGNLSNCGGIPLRLEMASRFYASAITIGASVNYEKSCAYDCLRMADTLIEAHNKTCGDAE